MSDDPYRIGLKALRSQWTRQATPREVVGWIFDALDAEGEHTVPRDLAARDRATVMAGMVFADLGDPADMGVVVSHVLRAAQVDVTPDPEPADNA